MYHSIHTDFIVSPILEILKDGVNACKGVEDGLETQPLSEYILSSLFLRLTGAQEQKLKCICWEIATHDYDFRYDFISGKFRLGECSGYESKNKICSFLQQQIAKLNGKGQYTISQNIVEDLIDEAILSIENLFENTNISIWEARNFTAHKNSIRQKLTHRQILVTSKDKPTVVNLFDRTIQEDYKEFVHTQRNRLAHNTTSYQRHLPKLEILSSQDYNWHNYFYRYSLLVLIDFIFIHLYKEYRHSLESYS